jgi:DNA-binding transcriptional LysR family regulator
VDTDVNVGKRRAETPDDRLDAFRSRLLARRERNVVPVRGEHGVDEIGVLYPAFVLLPSLLESLEQQAPGISVAVQGFNHRDDAVDLLDSGAIDAAIGVPPTLSDRRILTCPILRDEFVTILARDHPAARRGMNMKAYLALAHVLASPEGDRHGLVDQLLAEQGKKRRIALTLPQMFAVPAVVARTNTTATVMKRVALGSPAGRQLVLFPPPVAVPEVVFHLVWHRRNDNHPAQVWWRDFIVRHAGSLR